jgi:hypothetical protein
MKNCFGKIGSLLLLALFILSLQGICAINDDIRTRKPAYSLLERLMYRPQQVSVHQFSSHNKKGLNGDENWPLYVDENGDDVIFDAAGPGCIRSMWGTNFDPDAILKFYFDGEKKPRYTMKYIEFYQGKHPLFPSPLVSYEKRGMWGDRPYSGNSFVPIPFAKWLKISVQGKSRFFHILYEKYPYKTPIETFSGREDRKALINSFADLGVPPLELSYPPSAEDSLELYETSTEIIDPAQNLTLLKIEDASGIIRKIELEADGSPEFFQDTLLRMRWDGHTHWDVHTPTGIFFGSAVEADEMRSLPLTVEVIDNGRVRLSSYFPMPFWEKVEIEWLNRSQHRMSPLKAKVYVDKNPIRIQDGLYFTTIYREGKTTYGQDWLLFEGQGTGWYVGTVQSMQNAHYCEGDEHFYVDGAISPQINGTGSEDYYLACFWPNVDFDMPFGCVVGDITQKGGGDMVGAYYIPSCYSRYHLEAPLPFYASLSARIQHGGLSHILSNYRSISFCYRQRTAALKQTDFLDIGNSASEKAHAYALLPSSSGAEEPNAITDVTELTAHPEGEYFTDSYTDSGRTHSTSERIGFVVAVDPKNHGVRLRRRIDQAHRGQKAEVYVDGQYAGTWYHGYENPHLRWYDIDIDLHPEFTRGKSQLEVELKLQPGAEGGKFSEYSYSVFCFRKVE